MTPYLPASISRSDSRAHETFHSITHVTLCNKWMSTLVLLRHMDLSISRLDEREHVPGFLKGLKGLKGEKGVKRA